MTLSGINKIGSLYTRNAEASSSTTTMVPSLSPPSEKEDDELESEEEKENPKQTTEAQTKHPCSYYCHFSNNELKPHYYYDEYRKSNIDTNSKNNHSSCIHQMSIATTVPIPSYITSTTKTLATPSSMTSSSPTSPSSLTTSPKKRIKRWMIAALMVIVGLLIALTFILIGLGKAISRHHHYHDYDQKKPVLMSTINFPIPSLHDTHITTTIVVVPATTTITSHSST